MSPIEFPKHSIEKIAKAVIGFRDKHAKYSDEEHWKDALAELWAGGNYHAFCYYPSRDDVTITALQQGRNNFFDEIMDLDDEAVFEDVMVALYPDYYRDQSATVGIIDLSNVENMPSDELNKELSMLGRQNSIHDYQ